MVSMGQTITVVNKSGKIVSSSKHIVNVFKEAKSAYREKKAELRQERESEIERQLQEEARRKKKQYALDDDARSVSSSRSAHSHASSRRSSHSHDSHRHHSSSHRSHSHRSRPTVGRGYSDGLVDPHDGHRPPRRASTRASPTSPLKNSYTFEDIERKELMRRKSESDNLSVMQIPRKAVPRREEVDMDLAYGDMPPPIATTRGADEQELRAKMTGLQRLLEEANCLQHSATSIIKSLESNPEAMAAVALTLAEISNLATKLAPGALMSLKGAFPAVIALLISPEFLIAGGVAVGVTVIAFGGYKIVKKMKAKKALEGVKTKEMLIEDQMVAGGEEDLESIHTDVDRIENWRRGISAGALDSPSAGTSVDGEFITPGAASQLRSEGVLAPKKERAAREKEKKEAEKGKKEMAKRERAEKEERKVKEKADKKAKEKEEAKAKKEKEEAKAKKEKKASKKSEVVGAFV